MDDTGFDCPLCMEEMDPTDRHFKPCPCGYQVCRFCWNRIRQNENQKCPACRRTYTDDAVEFTPLSADELLAIQSSKKKKMQPSLPQASHIVQTTRKEFQDDDDLPVLAGRRHLVDVRVTQKNLVYVIGIPIHLADDATLREEDFFGRFGRIVKLVVNKKAYVRTTGTGAISNAAAYITYSRDDEALKAIKLIDGKMLDGAKLLRATYGTTKYCAHFLRGRPCPKAGCLYLHHEVEGEVTGSADDPAVASVYPKFTSSSSASSVVSPTASPAPNICEQIPADHKVEPLESDHTRSFFERLQRWTRMDELLADISPDSVSAMNGLQGGFLQTSFNPFEDDSASCPNDGIVNDLIREAFEHNENVNLKPVSVRDIFGAQSDNGIVQETSSNDKQPSPSRPFTEVLAKKTAVVEKLPKPIERAERVVEKPIVKKIAPKTFTTSQQQNGKKSAEKIAQPATPPSKIAPKPQIIHQKRPTPLVSNDNLFSVLQSGDLESEQSTFVEPDSPIEQEQQPSLSSKKPVVVDKKKKFPKNSDDDLDILLKQVEESNKKTQTEKTLNSAEKPAKAKQNIATPSPPQAPKASPTFTASSASGNARLLSRMEEEAAKRVLELEEMLRSSRLEAEDVEERLRESIGLFLDSLNMRENQD